MIRRPRWRCARPDCPAHRWQTVDAPKGRDPLDVASEALARHWREQHDEAGEAAA